MNHPHPAITPSDMTEHPEPRRINSFATGAMIVAASRKQRMVTEQDVRDSDVDGGRP